MFHIYIYRFYKCLCDKRKMICSQGYNPIAIQLYSNSLIAIGHLQSINLPEGESPTDLFVCDPGGFGTAHKINCHRWSDASPRCGGKTPCQSYHVNLNYGDCDSKCLRLDWARHLLTAVNTTGDYPDMTAGGVCDKDEDREGRSNGASQLQTPNSGSLVAAVVIGWILAAILLGIIIAYIVYRNRKSEPRPNTQVRIRSESLPNSYEGLPTGNPQGRGVRGLDIIHPLPAEGDGITGYDSCTPNGDPSADYTVIEEGRVMSTPQQAKKLDQIKAMLKKRPLPGTENGASTSAKKGSDASISGSDGYYLASRQGISPEQEDETSSGETAYTILEREEHTQDGKSAHNSYASTISDENSEGSKTPQTARIGNYAELNSRSREPEDEPLQHSDGAV